MTTSATVIFATSCPEGTTRRAAPGHSGVTRGARDLPVEVPPLRTKGKPGAVEFAERAIKQRPSDVRILDTATPVQVQKGSRLDLNGEQMNAEDLDVKGMYKTIMKPGISR